MRTEHNGGFNLNDNQNVKTQTANLGQEIKIECDKITL